jgi:hypothetical protein
MKRPLVVIVSILAPTLAGSGVTGYLAWKSLSSVSTLQSAQSISPQSIALSQPAILTPVPVSAATSPAAPALPPAGVATSTSVASAPATPVWSQAQNDYLYDLSQTLQPVEQQRRSQAEQLAIAAQIQQWLENGADRRSLRQQFDGVYAGQIAGNYARNRNIYIKLAAKYFSPQRPSQPFNQVPDPPPYSTYQFNEYQSGDPLYPYPAQEPELMPISIPYPPY